MDDDRRTRGTGTVTRLPSGSYRGRASLTLADGTRKRISVTGRTLRDAERKLRKALDAAETGTVPTTVTVAQWLDVWQAQRAGTLRAGTVEFYGRIVRVHTVPYIGRVRLDRLTPTEITRWLQRLRDDGRREPTVRDAYGTLRTALKAAYMQGLIPSNPTDRVPPPRPGHAQTAWLTPGQLHTLARWADGQPDPELRVRLHLACHGLRMGELLGVAWPDLDLDTATLTVRRQVTRTQYRHGPGCGCPSGAPPRKCPTRTGGTVIGPPKSTAGTRAVPLTPQCVAALKAWRREQAARRLRAGSQWRDTDGLVLCDDLGRLPEPRRHTDVWWAALAAAGLPRVGTHAARRGAITALAMAGVPVKVAQSVAGHSTVALTMDVYARVTDDATRVAADVWAAPAVASSDG